MDPRWVAAALGAGACGLIAQRLGWLRADGAAAAFVVGAAVFGATGWAGAVPLLAFFVTSTLLGRLPGRAAGRRHGARDARQVVANGGLAALAALAAAAGWPAGLTVLGGALAAANADTWATEIGSRYGGTARRLGLGRPVGPGASGGMTAAGTIAGVCGAAAIGLLAGGWAATAAGVAGLLADSLLGGTLQAVYRCPICGAVSETPVHPETAPGGPAGGCRERPLRVRGHDWLDNDAVNLAATLIAAGVAAAAARP